MKTGLAIAATLLPLAAAAQDVTALDPIIISGGITPLSTEAYGRAYSVLTGDEIEKRGIATLQDALRAVPGVSVNGSGPTFTQVRIRGGESNHTLILIDGVELGAGDGEYVLSGLETANIDRIEVLRGPQSVFYGSNASSGVINIITKTGGPGLSYGGAVEAGSGYAASGHVSQRGERGGLSFNLSRRYDQGFDQSGDGGEKDAIERDTAGISGDYQLTDDIKLGFTLRRSWERYDYDGNDFFAADADGYVVDDPTLYSDRDETTGMIWGEYSMMGGRLTHRLSFSQSEFDQGFGGFSPTSGHTEELKYRASFGLDGRVVADSAHLLNFMAERHEDRSNSAPGYKRETTSVALEYRGQLANGIDLQAGLRHDANSVFSDADTWTVGLAYTLPDSGIRLHASAGTGIVNPTYFELFANAFGYTGNPNLKPEKNRGFDLGAEIPLMGGRGSLDITYFNETLTDEITSVFTGSGFTYENQAGDSDRQGVEVAGRLAATDAVDVRLSYTYLDARNPGGSVELRRPRHELGLGATVDAFGGRGSVEADLRYVADNYDAQSFGTFATAKLPDYATVDVAANYALTDNVTLTGRITNLFDTDHSDVWGYASRGRTAYVGLRAEW